VEVITENTALSGWYHASGHRSGVFICAHYSIALFVFFIRDWSTCIVNCVIFCVKCFLLPSVLWHCWLGVRKSIWPVKIEWRGADVVVCLERGANDLHVIQLMPLPPHHLLLHKNPEWFYLSGAGLPRLFWKRSRETGVCLWQVLLLMYRWYRRNSRKALDFDNPVYRHTTTSQFMVLQPKSLSSVRLTTLMFIVIDWNQSMIWKLKAVSLSVA